jgi:cystine transport system substrate-binding protein
MLRSAMNQRIFAMKSTVSILRFALAALLPLLGFAAVGSAQSADLLQEVKARGTLTVGLEGTYPPFSFQDKGGKLAGFEVDFANALAKELGVKAVFRPTKWDGILAALESKRIDVAINQVTISEERKNKYDFSVPYTVSGIQAVTRKGEEAKFQKPADLNAKKVGVGLGTNYEQWLKANVPGADIRTYDDDATKYQDLRVRRLDAILIDRLAAFDLIKKTENSLAVAGEPFARQEAGIPIRKGNPEFLAAVNKAIEKLRSDGTLTQLSQKWFSADVTR